MSSLWETVTPNKANRWQKNWQFWDAFLDRLRMLGMNQHSIGSAQWGGGLISTVTDNGDGTITVLLLTSAGAGLSGAITEDRGVHPEWDYYPTQFKLCIEGDNPLDPKGVTIPITFTWDTTTSSPDILLTFTKPGPFNADQTDVNNYVGRKLFIITGLNYPQSASWAQRVLPWPNDHAIEFNTTSGSTSTVTGTGWTTSAFVGDHIFIAHAGKKYRFVITSNTDTTITFTGTVLDGGVTIGDSCAIVPADGYYEPGRKSPLPWAAFVHDAAKEYRFWKPDLDEIGITLLRDPAPAESKYEGSPPSCHGDTSPTFDGGVDLDPRCPAPDQCDVPDRMLAGTTLQSWRGLQCALARIAPAFLLDRSADGMKSIPMLTMATWFEQAGINSFRNPSSAPTDSDKADFIWYAYLDSNLDDDIVSQGYITNWAGLPGPPTLPTGHTANLVVSLGFSRWQESKVRHAYDRSAFVPDIAEGTTQFPPNDTYTGSWETRPRSNHLLHVDDLGFVTDSTKSIDELTEGQRVRYVGDNQNDPQDFPVTVAVGDSAITDDYVRCLGAFRETIIGPFAAIGLSGNTLEGLPYGLRTSSLWSGSPMRTETGVADGGTTVYLTDSTKIGSVWWQSAHGRYTGFTVEITQGSSTYHRFITIFDEATGKIGWADALPLTANGCAYSIKEPDRVLNRWQQHKLTYTDTTSIKRTVLLLGNDDQWLWWTNNGHIPQIDTIFSIEEIPVGSTCDVQSDGSLAVVDDIYLGKGTPLNGKLHGEIRKLYGFRRKLDLLPLEFFQELKASFAPLRRVNLGALVFDGKSRGAISSPGPFTGDPHSWTDVADYAEYEWTGTVFDESVPPLPICWYHGDHVFYPSSPLVIPTLWGDNWSATLVRACAQFKANPVALNPGTVEFLLWTTAVDSAYIDFVTNWPDETETPFTGEYDDEGDPVKQDKWSSVGPDPTSTHPIAHFDVGNTDDILSAWVGPETVPLPDRCATPGVQSTQPTDSGSTPAGTTYGAEIKGYQATALNATVRYDTDYE